MDETKSIFASKTFWGAIIAAISGLGGVVGINVTPDEQTVLVSALSALGMAVGTVLTIVGRMKADKKVG